MDRLEDWVAEQYRKRGYFVKEQQGYLLLRFVEDAARPHAIIKCVERERPLSAKEVFSMFTDFEHLHTGEKPCFQYRIICPSGFDPDCKEFQRYNVSLSDASYLKEITKRDYVYLFAHNELMCQNIREAFQKSRRVAAVQATGSGKSLLIAEMVKDMSGKEQMIIVPRRNIISEVQRQLPKGIPGVSFRTYQHLCQMSKDELSAIRVDRFYLDEFHHMGAEKWSKAVNVLLQNNPEAQVLGTTATACHISSKEGKRDISKLIFDQTAGEMPLEEALVRHVLTTPHYVCMPSSYEEVKDKLLALPEVAKSPEKAEQITHMVDEMAVKQPVHELLAKHMPKKTGRMLVFCPTVEELKRNKPIIRDLLKKAGFSPVIFEYYHSASDSRTTKGLDVMLAHKTTRRLQVLFCVDMLNEGVHIPDVTAAIFMRRTDSDTLFKQQLGRLMDAASTHETVVFDMVDNIFNRNIQNIKESVERAMKQKKEQMEVFLGFYQERHPVKFEIVDYNEAIREQELRIAGPQRAPQKRFTLAERLDALEQKYRKRNNRIYIPAQSAAARQDYEFLYNVLERFKNDQLSEADREVIVQRLDWLDMEMRPRFTQQLYEMVDDFKRNPSQNIMLTHKQCFKELSVRLVNATFTKADFEIINRTNFMMSWFMKLDANARVVYKGLKRGELDFLKDTGAFLKQQQKQASSNKQQQEKKRSPQRVASTKKEGEQVRPVSELGKVNKAEGAETAVSRKRKVRI